MGKQEVVFRCPLVGKVENNGGLGGTRPAIPSRRRCSGRKINMNAMSQGMVWRPVWWLWPGSLPFHCRSVGSDP